eukprot:scaffold31704_cov90-Isochrysis_galbana.AAC.1
MLSAWHWRGAHQHINLKDPPPAEKAASLSSSNFLAFSALREPNDRLPSSWRTLDDPRTWRLSLGEGRPLPEKPRPRSLSTHPSRARSLGAPALPR